MKLRLDILKFDITVKKNHLAIPASHVYRQMGISESTYYRAFRNIGDLTIDNFCKMASWTGKDINRYFDK